MGYFQLTEEDRYRIGAMKTAGSPIGDIARELKRHRSTIYREISRNESDYDGYYRPQFAGENTRGRRSRSRRNLHYGAEHFASVEAMLREDYSPEQIVGRLRLEGLCAMSHETI